jgi:formate-dependent nitrite reductase membrane component NrfD
VLNQPSWKAPDIAGYFFLGGLAGASSLLGAGAQLTGRPALERGTKVVAAGSIGLSLAALIHDLGRPARFVNMLRVVKVTSPMSIGSWLLAAYAPASMAAAATAVTRRLPAIGGLATGGAALLGPAVASYTGALVANTAVPAWHDGHREMPLLFAASGAAAAGGAGMVLGPLDEAGPARRLGAIGSAVELTLAKVMERRMGMAGEPYHTGTAGRLMRGAEVLGAAGAVGSVTIARRSRVGAIAAGAALVASSALTRFGIFQAGLQSAADPRYVVEPQRARL